MIAITIHQPWASLLVHGYKKFETRGWETPYRGMIAIHAGKTWRRDQADLWELLKMQLIAVSPALQKPLPLGAVLGVGYLKAIYPTEKLAPKLSPIELKLGNYEAGRYAWQIEMKEVFQMPLAVAGQQRLWNVELDKLSRSGELYYGR